MAECSEVVYEEEDLYTHPRAKSKAWIHFGFKKDSMGKLVKDKGFCRICRSSIAYSENTSNQTYHLQKQHLLAFKEVEKERKHSKDDEKQAKQLESYSMWHKNNIVHNIYFNVYVMTYVIS